MPIHHPTVLEARNPQRGCPPSGGPQDSVPALASSWGPGGCPHSWAWPVPHHRSHWVEASSLSDYSPP